MVSHRDLGLRAIEWKACSPGVGGLYERPDGSEGRACRACLVAPVNGGGCALETVLGSGENV